MLTPVPARQIASLNALVRSLPEEKIPDLIRATVAKIPPRKLSVFEKKILKAAVESTDTAVLRKARDLYGRYGHLFYLAAPHVDDLRKELDLVSEPQELLATLETSGDIRAQINWAKLDRMILGEFHGLGVLYDPVGNLSGLLSVFDRQAMIARFTDREGEVPPAFGALSSRETPERLEQANEKQRFGDLKEIGFGDPDAFLMTVVPRIYADYFRKTMAYQAVVPTAKILSEQVTGAWAESLPNETVVLTGIKSLTEEGMTPLEHFRDVLKEVKRRDVAVIDVLGYLPASKLMQEQRDYGDGKLKSLEPVDTVLASTHRKAALEMAQRWAGPDAVVTETVAQGVPVTVFQSTRLPRPMRISVISDPDVIRVQEKASIDKNLQALQLGGGLFAAMLREAKAGVPWSDALKEKLREEYDGAMQGAEKDILEAISREMGIAPVFLLDPIRRDLVGSWDIRDMEHLYGLVQKIFSAGVSASAREEAMSLLKSKIRSYYSVRNPCYGFCIAADREALRRGLSLSSVQGSMIPEGLEYPEGLQTAEQLVKRYGPDLQGLPESYKDAYFLVSRLQESFYLAPELHEELVAICARLLSPVGRDLTRAKNDFLRLLEELAGVFVKGQSFLESSRSILSENGNASDFLKKLLEAVPALSRVVSERGDIMLRDLVLLKQGVVEILVLANRFHMLPFHEHEKIARRLRLKILKLIRSGRSKNRFLESEISPEKPESSDIVLNHGSKGALKTRLNRLIASMNELLHHQKRAISPDNILDALYEMTLSCYSPQISQGSIDLKRLQPFSPRQKLLIYQSILEAVVSVRSVLVFSEAGYAHSAEQEKTALKKKLEMLMAYFFKRTPAPESIPPFP